MHITNRGNNRSTIMLDDADRTTCFDLLQEARLENSCSIHAYVFMDNHYHLLLTPTDHDGLAIMMHWFAMKYVQHFNKRYGRTGSMWEGRYKSSVVQSSRYFLTCSRYIELNPVRALMVERPEYHRWSSYQCNAAGEPNVLITPHALYRNLAKRERDRRSAYRALFSSALDPADVSAIRAATKRNAVVGDAAYRDAVQRQLGKKISDGVRGGDRRSAAHAEDTFAAV